MQQLLSVWFAIDARKRVIVGLSVIAMFAAIIGLSRLATAPTFALLYSNLDTGSAGEIVKALEQRGATFEIRGNSIFVESSTRDQLRMTLATEGLPANSGQGYELLDSLSGFGTTAQMFDAAYWRAKEGELARTIVAGPQYSVARIHIANMSSQPFRRAVSPAASVMLTATSGTVSPTQAKAIKYLVSSAVAGMNPSDVAVIDGRNGNVVQDDSVGANATNSSDRAAELKQNIKQMLEARVGVGKAVVEVFVELNSERVAVTERTFDPDSRVAISSQKEERTTSSDQARGGAVTVASNLPEGDASGSGNKSNSQESETIENTNYEVSETTREMLRSPGSISKISVAVLVDGFLETDPDTNTQTWTPRSDTELGALHELVSAAIGFDEERGDTITLKTLQFEAPEATGVLATSSVLQNLNFDAMRLIQILVLALVTLILGLFVLRPILSMQPAPALPDLTDKTGFLNKSTTGEGSQPLAITGEIDDRGSVQDGLPVVQTADTTVQPPDPVERLRNMISERQDESVEILRTWIDSNEEHA